MARMHARLTQREIADALGIKQQAYGHYETGRNGPRNKRQFCMAVHMITGVDLGWLETGELPQTGGHDGDGLPLMDSNHQPCVTRLTSGNENEMRRAA